MSSEKNVISILKRPKYVKFEENLRYHTKESTIPITKNSKLSQCAPVGITVNSHDEVGNATTSGHNSTFKALENADIINQTSNTLPHKSKLTEKALKQSNASCALGSNLSSTSSSSLSRNSSTDCNTSDSSSDSSSLICSTKQKNKVSLL